ncbi:MAG: aminotransferase class I/II-fold pyridoxal phosphate-dependent enzyme [Treponema sp.]|jgi:aspartate/methionine/tyrosine aminotransferase|nr:aminotransferase class I/II-fold pyridoxal phosphate-dependent enzyme [Treponema sp.]
MNYRVEAEELNTILDETVAGRFLSGLGRRLYFPKGIIAQSAEAKKSARLANATIGMAYHKGSPLILSAMADSMPTLSPAEIVAYSPTAGIEEIRCLWKQRMLAKNPTLDGNQISLPVVVPGLSAGISYTADLFLDEGNTIITSHPSWDNYELIFQERRGATIQAIPFFGTGTGLDINAIAKALKEEAQGGSVRIILNFPNNPSGYAPTYDEVEALITLIAEIANGGADVLVLCDDAYFGLFYEDSVSRESLFARLSTLHEQVLAIKIDGPTKEDYVWGLRIGFVTMGSRGLCASHYDALEKKYLGVIRSSVSCSNTPAQHLMMKAVKDVRTIGERQLYYDLLKSRYEAVKRFVNETPANPRLRPLPFNSGYFMSFRCVGISASALRRELLDKHGIGTIAFGDEFLRIAFASLEAELIPAVYQSIYQVASGL